MDTFQTSAEVDKLFPALVAAQGDGLIAIESSDNKQVGSRYADLIKVWHAVRPILHKHGLAVLQPMGRVRSEGTNFVMGLTCIVAHESGQWLSAYAEVLTPRNDKLSPAWWIGSAVTYLKRYSLCAILGVVTGDDDDAQGVSRMHSAEPVAGRVAPASAATGDFAAFVGGVWKEQAGPDGRPLGEYSMRELKALVGGSITEGAESEPLKACIFDTIEARLRALGESLVPALESREWAGFTVPSEWSLKEFREVGMLLLTPKKEAAAAGGTEP